MLLKDLCEVDFANYKKSAMFIIFPNCSFKCDRESGKAICQNSSLAGCPNIDFPMDQLVDKYMSNPMSHSVVCGGLEPFDSWDDLQKLIYLFRDKTEDDFVIYTGYTEEEVADKVEILKQYKNIIIKFGRFRPDEDSHYDEVLGVKLASNNQYAKKIS